MSSVETLETKLLILEAGEAFVHLVTPFGHYACIQHTMNNLRHLAILLIKKKS